MYHLQVIVLCMVKVYYIYTLNTEALCPASVLHVKK